MSRPSMRFRLDEALVAIMGIAILIAHVRNFQDLDQREASVVLGVTDGDTRALAREMVSSAVLDEAVNNPTGILFGPDHGHFQEISPGKKDFSLRSGLPRFANSTNPQADLRRLLRVDSVPKTHAVRPSVAESPYHDEMIILNAVAAACSANTTPVRITVLNKIEFSNKWSESQFIINWILLGCWAVFSPLMLGRRKFKKGS